MSLYLVGTPLGNLGDMSPRAKETLRDADVLAAEDTRSLRRLLSAFDIPINNRPMLSYGEHNEKGMAPKLGGYLAGGKSVALLSDGGMPLVSDPGYRLVQEAIAINVSIVPIPGPCAAIAALAASGLPVHGFIFRGFLPKKPGVRVKILESLKDREETLIFYESPHRLAKVLEVCKDIFGPDRQACLAQEMTKIHERFWRGTLSELCEELAIFCKDRKLKGEWTFLIAGEKPVPKSNKKPDSYISK